MDIPVQGGQQGQIPIAQQQQQVKEAPGEPAAGISGAPPPPAGQRILSREERIEYRDQDGNVLNEEQVKALEGKVEFKTRYETRTRVVDENGNEVVNLGVGESRDQDGQGKAAAAPPPPAAEADGDQHKTKKLVPDEPIVKDAAKSVEGENEAKAKLAKPASEGNEATAGQ